MLEQQEQKPKVDGKKPNRRPFRPMKKEFETKVVGLETHTFDIGHAKYAAKFIKSRDEIVLYVQEKHEQGAVIAEAMRTMTLKGDHAPALSQAEDRRNIPPRRRSFPMATRSD